MSHPGMGKPSHLNPAMYEEFSEEIVSLAVYARTRARVNYDYFGPVNETDCYPSEGPRVDPDEMPKLLATIARRMKKEGLGDVRLVVAEQALLPNNYAGPILEDAELMKQVGVFAFHTYGKDSVGTQVERIRKSGFPHVPVWLTEYGDLDDLDRSAENEWKNFSLAASERALTALNQGASAALYWDAYDNYHEHYPRLTFYGLVRNADHVYTPKKRYFAAKQLYRFVRPGSVRIAASSDTPGLIVSAFWNGASNSFTVVGEKSSGVAGRVQVSLAHADAAPASWDLYETTRTLDCLKVDSVTLHNGVAEFDLPAEAVFTLVGTVRQIN